MNLAKRGAKWLLGLPCVGSHLGSMTGFSSFIITTLKSKSLQMTDNLAPAPTVILAAGKDAAFNINVLLGCRSTTLLYS